MNKEYVIEKLAGKANPKALADEVGRLTRAIRDTKEVTFIPKVKEPNKPPQESLMDFAERISTELLFKPFMEHLEKNPHLFPHIKRKGIIKQ